ncbi:hypothetical protein [Moraxella sp.]|uniref:hypothetical protein n=1 Tax=Moraxella sp. TaxID=479 RepID=UPI002629D222|nr:hypothetical protein [Moraxella sp.]MCP3897940.1 hypothetical protein [Moraxella sp.]
MVGLHKFRVACASAFGFGVFACGGVSGVAVIDTEILITDIRTFTSGYFIFWYNANTLGIFGFFGTNATQSSMNFSISIG